LRLNDLSNDLPTPARNAGGGKPQREVAAMSAVGSILGIAAPSTVPPQIPAEIAARAAAPFAPLVQVAPSAAARTVAGAQAGVAQASLAEAVANAQTVAAGAKAAAVAGASGVAPLASGVIAQLIAAQTPPSQSAAAPDPGLAAVSSGSDPATAFLAYMHETPGQRLQSAWLANHKVTETQLAAMPIADRQAIEKRMQTEIADQITQVSENKLKAKTVALA
jgi:hypothetical protein